MMDRHIPARYEVRGRPVHGTVSGYPQRVPPELLALKILVFVVGAAVVVYEADVVGAGGVSVGDVDASAECETNRTVKLVTASAVLANPAIFARFVIFKAVTRCLLGCDKNRARGQRGPGHLLLVPPRCAALVPYLGDTRA